MSTIKLVSREFEGFERAFAHQAEAYAKAYPGDAVDRQFIDIVSLHKNLIENGGALSDEYDLFLCVTDWLPEAIQKGLLTPLNDLIANDPPQDWPHGWSPSMLGLQTAPDGNIYGMPYHDGPELFMYRTDLFDDPAEKQSFKDSYGYELAPPKTWSEFLDIAKFFTRPERGLWGACFAGYPDAHNNIYDFFIHLWTRGGTLLDADNRPGFNSEIGREALQYYADLLHVHKVVSPECLKLDSIASGFYYAAGNAAMMWNWSGFAALAEQPTMSKIVGKNGVALMPKGDGPNGESVSLNIYWTLTIPTGSKRKEEAYRFLKHLAQSEMDKATSMLGGNGVRLSTWRDAEVQATFPYYKIIEQIHRNVKSPPSIPEFTALSEILCAMVDDVLNQRTDVASALAKAEREACVLLDAKGKASV